MKSTTFRWIPRTIAIFSILFISIFAADAFEGNDSFLSIMADFMIHLIPSFILLAILMIAWIRELLGGILFAAIGIIFSAPVYIINYHRTGSVFTSTWIVSIITLPFIVTGILFLLSHSKRKSELKEENKG